MTSHLPSTRLGAASTSTTAPPTLPALRLEHVTHWFPSRSARPRLAVDDVSFDVPQAQFVALVGASGCGKTTILNIVAGMITPELGRVDVELPGERGVLGYMWARDALLPWRTLQKNVEFGLELSGLPRRARRSRAEAALRLVGLADSADQYPSELSHGMRQRGNLARLLATEPDLILLDEPFSALDAQTKLSLQTEFVSILQARPRTVLYVTHDLTEAALLADRVLVVHQGRIRHDVAVAFERPRDIGLLRFDAGFQAFAARLWDLLAELRAEDLS